MPPYEEGNGHGDAVERDGGERKPLIRSQHQHHQQHHRRSRSGGNSDPLPNVRRITKRRHSRERSRAMIQGEERSDYFPEDESHAAWKGSLRSFRGCWMNLRRGAIVCMHRALLGRAGLHDDTGDESNDHTGSDGATKKTDGGKLKSMLLLVLAIMAFVFMEFGLEDGSSAYHRSGGDGTNDVLGYGRGGDYFDDGDAATATIRGHQARGQVPIPIEYASFVELSEFADAVALVRAYNKQSPTGMGEEDRAYDVDEAEEDEGERRLRRRLDAEGNDGETRGGEVNEQNGPKGGAKDQESDNPEAAGGGDGEESEMKKAIDKSWEEISKKANPNNSDEDAEGEEDDGPQTKLLKARLKHVPFFWHIPRSGGTTLSTLLASCHSLVQASSSFTSPPVYKRGADEALASRFRDPTLYVVATEGSQFVNVDLDSMEGVQRAVNGKLIEKELADVVAVPDARLGSLLFGRISDSDGGGVVHRGVLFALFRHPVERTVSWFYHKQNVKDSVHYDPSLEIYSLADWVNSPSYIPDYMVRTLVGKVGHSEVDQMEGGSSSFRPPVLLTPKDLDVAKEILRRKCIVGLLEEKGESVARFEKFFGWSADVRRATEDEAKQAERWKDVKDEECRDRLLHWDWMGKNKHPELDAEEGGSSATLYRLVEGKNRYDIKLYMYARQLFAEQRMQLGFDEDVMGDI